MNLTTKTPLSHEDFLRLFLRSEREIFRYVVVLVPRVEDAQDVVQETAVALWRKIGEYDPSRPFVAWACRFALLEARQFLKRSRRWRGFLDDAGLAEKLLARRQEIAEHLDERQQYLGDCIRKLSGRHRSLLERYYYRRTSMDDLCRETGRSAGALYKALQRIRQALFDCITRSMDAEGTRP